MADYHSPTVVQPAILNTDMTALERLLLTHIFESAPDGDGLYFFAETSPRNQFELPIETIRAALTASDGVPSEAVAFVREQLKEAGDDDEHVDLDMAAAGWRPTVENYLGRVPKVRIIEAVREAKGEHSARLIEHLKKADMAREAERLLDGAGWLPEPLRVAQTGLEVDAPIGEVGEAEALPDFLGEDEDDAQLDAEEEQPHAAAAAE